MSERYDLRYLRLTKGDTKIVEKNDKVWYHYLGCVYMNLKSDKLRFKGFYNYMPQF